MQLKTARKSMANLVGENRTLKFVALGATTIAVLLTFKVVTMHERLVIQPPHLTKKAIVAFDHASTEYFEPMALYIVSTISSVVPESVDFVSNSMEQFFDPEVWVSLKPQLLAVKSNPKYNGINAMSYFQPTNDIIYEPSTKKFYVSGKLTSSAYSKGAVQNIGSVQATYELKMYMKNGLPRVSYFKAYTGEPMTEAWVRSHKDLAEKRQENTKQVIPDARESEITRDSISQPAPSQPNQPNKVIEEQNAPMPEQPAASPAGLQAVPQLIDGVEPPAGKEDVLP
ncbi:MAG: hypothetical protein D8H97_24915 [Neisseria sp.]|jgi:hypothetical protein|uniref:TraE/TraK family type IV conjugative transfer system protein n=1 Tax=Neisseria subflava TaxID=28449 RepID=UPI000D313D8F|nr:TraE/TraK family type IV conjugative transfer system protein [Neisseria subflava]RKV74852.1 MAG: hypothetical protein D8H97_24915 [Neisseria sp.]